MKMSEARPISTIPVSTAPAARDWDLRLLAVVVVIAALAGTLGYLAGRGPSMEVHVLTGNAYAGQGQISALASDGVTYAIPLDAIEWIDSRGSFHDRGRAECLPADMTTGTVTFVAVEWNVDGVTRRSVVRVDCRS
jgi:hypothetical protein